MAEQLRLVGFGFLVAIVPRIALVGIDLRLGPSPEAAAVDHALRLVTLACAIALLARAVSRVEDLERRRRARRLVVATAAVDAAVGALWMADVVILAAPAALSQQLHPLANFLSHGLTFSVRWFVFAAAMGYGIVRFQLLAVDPASSRRTATVAGAGAIGASAAAAGLLGGPAAAGLAAALAGLVCVSAAGSPGGRSRSPGYLHHRSLEVYRALLAAHAASGSNGGTTGELARARTRLGITQVEHDALAAIAQVEEAQGSSGPVLYGRYRVVRRLGAGGTASV